MKYGAEKTVPTYRMDWNPSITFEQRVDKLMSWITNETNPANLAFLYFEEPDELAHAYGPESPQVTEMIQKLDNVTGYLVGKLKSAGIYDDVNLIFLSDHGFQEVSQKNMINISEAVDTNFYDRYGTTPMLQIHPKKGTF